MINIIILILLLIIINSYKTINKQDENFISCKNMPLGPYITSCSNINYNNNILSAYCKNNDHEQNFTSLYLDSCNDANDCNDENDCNGIYNNDGILYY